MPTPGTSDGSGTTVPPDTSTPGQSTFVYSGRVDLAALWQLDLYADPSSTTIFTAKCYLTIGDDTVEIPFQVLGPTNAQQWFGAGGTAFSDSILATVEDSWIMTISPGVPTLTIVVTYDQAGASASVVAR